MKSIKILSAILLAVFLNLSNTENVYASGGFWEERIQGRIDLLGILANENYNQPFIFSNIFSLGFALQAKDAPVLVNPYISILGSGAFHYDEVNGNEEVNGSAGGGLSLGARIRLWRYFSIKPEISGLYLKGVSYTYGILEFTSEFGIMIPNQGPWSLSLDIMRLGVKPGEVSIPKFSVVLCPSIGVIYQW